MKSICYLGLSLIPLTLLGCQTAAIDETQTNDRMASTTASTRQALSLTDGRRLTFNIPKAMTIRPAQGFESSGVMFFDENTLVRIAVGLENGSVSCLPDRTCKQITTQNAIGEIPFYLEHLESPRSGEDIMHPTNRAGTFSIAIRSLSPLEPGARLFVEGFCYQTINCEKIVSSFYFDLEQ